MKPNSGSEPHLDRYQSQSELHSNQTNDHKILANVASQSHPLQEKSTKLLLNGTETEKILNAGNAQLEIEADKNSNLQKQLKQLQHHHLNQSCFPP